ncbi:helix-turn-helix domain-containing protein [Endozoicomonas lisbonensis]|uniref:AraC family transcriptional activator of pobA n=1 Tax=Endozoicomonas lisbonensis TaxID=3120522 RepID=A0ABV2SLB7_9GAMM
MLEVKKLPTGTLLDIENVKKTDGIESIEPHRHQYFEIFWVISGEGSHSIDFMNYPLCSGLIYFITPGQVHHVHDLPDGLYAISFCSSLISSDFRSQKILEQIFFNNRSYHPSISVDSRGKQALKKLLEILSTELGSPDCDNELINMLFTGFLRYLMRYQPVRDDIPKANDERMTFLLSLIDSHYTDRRNADFYADKLSLGSKRVNELSQKYFSKTVTQLIHEKILVEARRQLAFTTRTVKAISYDLGYQDVAYFSRFYKKATGESPQDFRHNWFRSSG